MLHFLPAAYDPSIVALSVIVAAAASYVSLDVAARIWPARGARRAAWILAAATAMGGGIWSMHFIGMLAFSLPVPIAYDPVRTAFSLAVAIALTAAAFAMVKPGSGNGRIAAAGAVMGMGVVVMHYSGMSAMELSAELVWIPDVVAASVVIACVAATAALWIALRVRGFVWRAVAAWVMAAAVAGMHYTAMDAACFVPAAGSAAAAAGGIAHGTLALLVSAGAGLILALELVSAMIDRRFSAMRQREEEILRLKERRFRSLLQASSDLILVVAADGRVDYAAPTTQAAAGVDPASFIGRNVFEVFAGRGLAGLQASLAREGDPSLAFVDGLEGAGAADGSGIPGDRRFEATVCDLMAEPSVQGHVMTIHDVTQRERAAEELLRAMRLADEANRLKSEFIANMNHELRTPLNSILGFAELLERKLKGPEQGFARNVQTAGQRLLSTIEDIIEYSKVEAGQIALEAGEVDPRTLAGDVVRQALPAARQKGVTVSCEAEGLAPFRGDERRLRQALLALLSNAVKFTPEGGSVVLRARALGEDVAFEVEDTGIGMAAGELERVFRPFYQVDGSFTRGQEGVGLGLAIAKSLVDLHGGRITLESAPGKGTIARIFLPAEASRSVA